MSIDSFLLEADYLFLPFTKYELAIEIGILIGYVGKLYSSVDNSRSSEIILLETNFDFSFPCRKCRIYAFRCQMTFYHQQSPVFLITESWLTENAKRSQQFSFFNQFSNSIFSITTGLNASGQRFHRSFPVKYRFFLKSEMLNNRPPFFAPHWSKTLLFY